MSYFMQHIESCFENTGVKESVFKEKLASLNPWLTRLKEKQCKATAALIDLPFQEDDLPQIEQLANEIRKRFRHVVVVGSGGSGLSGRMLVQMVQKRPEISLDFLENVDPDLMDQLLSGVDVEATCFIVISKSGSTAETVSQFFALWHLMKQGQGKKANEHFIIITAEPKSVLGRAAEEHHIRVIAHPSNIGGRFAALTAVGLLPAALSGLDIRKLRKGAASVVDSLMQCNDVSTFPPAQGAALQYAAMQAGRNLSVMLPYSERLSGFSAWYRQSWAESLGKSGKGTTPIRAVGTTDQHSQLQLYLDGPKDKLFTMIKVKRAGTGLAVNAPAHIDYLKNKTLGDVMEAEQRSTEATLKHNNCPVRVIELYKLDEEAMSILLLHFMFEIFCMGELLGVNPFDQPAVEEGKQIAREYLLGNSS